jgi:hypothetical protein
VAKCSRNTDADLKPEFTATSSIDKLVVSKSRWATDAGAGNPMGGRRSHPLDKSSAQSSRAYSCLTSNDRKGKLFFYALSFGRRFVNDKLGLSSSAFERRDRYAAADSGGEARRGIISSAAHRQ